MSGKPESPSERSLIAVLDQGKTNIKLSVLSADGVVLDAQSIPNPVLAGTLWRYHDVPAISEWVFDTLAALARRWPLGHFIATGHGVCGLLVTDDPDGPDGGQALPMIDYEQTLPAAVRDAYAALAGSFADRGSPIMLGAAHQARQLFWMQEAAPERFATARWALGLPQYWAWRLTGKAVCEWSHLGAQSHLYNIGAGHWSSIVAARGWTSLFGPFVHAYDDLGPVRDVLVQRYGLPTELRVHAGAHDSTANFYRYQATGMQDFTLLSTGTWIVAMADGIDPGSLREAQGMTCNIDVFGKALGGALVMGGREFEHVAPSVRGGSDHTADVRSIETLVRQGSFALPSFIDDDAQFPGSAGRGRFEGPDVKDPAMRWNLAVLYTALLAAECAGALGRDRPVVVDGAFTQDPLFCALLAALMPASVSTSAETNGVACGAALLAGHQDRGGRAAPPPPMSTASALSVPGLSAYQARWREMAGGS